MNDRPVPKVIMVDFDGTICGDRFPDCGPPEPHVREGLQKLKDAGFEVHIHSVSTNYNWGRENMLEHVDRIQDYMKEHDLPYTRIHAADNKPYAVAYIDDRGVAYRGDWLEAAEEAIRLGT